MLGNLLILIFCRAKKAARLVTASAINNNVNTDGNSGTADEVTFTFPHMPKAMCPGNVHT